MLKIKLLNKFLIYKKPDSKSKVILYTINKTHNINK